MSNDIDLDELAGIAYNQLGLQTSEIVEIALTRQIARNHAYLQRRARRGIHTPTDESIRWSGVK